MALSVRFELTCFRLSFQLFRRQREYDSMNKCVNCNKETINRKFCTKSCAGQCNGRLYPKRKKSTETVSCKGCNTQILKRLRRQYCEQCRCNSTFHGRLKQVNDIQIGTFRKRYLNEKRRTTSKNEPIRYHCHKMNRELKLTHKHCQVCGYNAHVQLCHIKPISLFTDTSTLQEINDPKNIVILCPNHHWELDHGLLNPELIPPR